MLGRLWGLGRTRGIAASARQRGAMTAAVAPAVALPAAAAAVPDASSSGAAPPLALLAAKEDAYGGMIVDAESLPSDPAAFAAALSCSLAHWRASGVRGVWLKVPLSKAALVGPAAAPEAGFAFHHAEADYVMMTRWLPQDAPSTLPPNASHQVGVGAFVLNERGEVLVVQEANGPLKGKQVWKMPTGLVNQGEDIIEAAEREVLEETGIATRFAAVLCMRQAHGFQFGKSDIFWCIGLRTTEPGQQPTPCEVEVDAARWMPLAEYASTQFQRGVPLYETMLDRCVAWAEGRYAGWTGAKLEAGLWGRQRQDILVWGADGSGSSNSGGGHANGACNGSGGSQHAPTANGLANGLS